MLRFLVRPSLARDAAAGGGSLLQLGPARLFSATAPARDDLRAAFAAALPREQERLKNIKKQYGDKELHAVTVNMVLGGMRGITGMLYETSLLDADEGIRFRGHSIPELQVRRTTRAHAAAQPRRPRAPSCCRPAPAQDC